MAKDPKTVPPEKRRRGTLHCSFCGTSEDDVDDLEAGPDCYICGGCIDLAHDIVEAARKRRAGDSGHDAGRGGHTAV